MPDYDHPGAGERPQTLTEGGVLGRRDSTGVGCDGGVRWGEMGVGRMGGLNAWLTQEHLAMNATQEHLAS